MTTSISKKEDPMDVASFVLPDVPRKQPSTKTKKVQRGIWYKADGSVFLVKPVNGKKFEYPELSRAVGGLIEGIRETKFLVNLSTGLISNCSHSPSYPEDDRTLCRRCGEWINRVPTGKTVWAAERTAKVTQVWANEDGLIDSLPLNPHTGTVANMETYRLSGYPDWWKISGDVLVLYQVPLDLIPLTESLRSTI
jgi:hypothetical protein